MDLSGSGMYRARRDLQATYDAAQMAFHELEDQPNAHSDWSLILRRHEHLNAMSVASMNLRALNARMKALALAELQRDDQLGSHH